MTVGPPLSTVGTWLRTSWAPLIASLLVAGAVGIAGGRLIDAREEQLRVAEKESVDDRLNGLGASLTSALNRRQALVVAIAAFAELHGATPAASGEFTQFASQLHGGDPAIQALQVFPRTGTVMSYPLDGNEGVSGRTLQDLLNDERPGVRTDANRAVSSQRVSISDPYPLRQGGLGMVVRQPIIVDGEVAGLATVVLNVGPIVEGAGLLTSGAELRVALKDSNGRVFFGEPGVFSSSPALHRIPLPEREWTLAAAPRAGWSAGDRRFLQWLRLSWIGVMVLCGGAAYTLTRRLSTLTQAVEVRTRQLAQRELDSRRLSEEAEAARAATEASQAQIEEMLDRMSDGFATLDAQWRYTFVNPRLATFVGRRREDMIGKSIWSLFPEAVGTPVYDAYTRAMAEQRAIELDHYYPPLERWFQHRFYPSLTGLSVFSRDITDRKRAEEALRARGEQFRDLVAQTPLPLCFAANDGTIRVMNNSFFALFGYGPSELRTLADWWTKAYPDPAYREKVIARWDRCLEEATRHNRELMPEEFLVTCKDGTERRIEISGRVMAGGFLATFVDITVRREAEMRASEAQQESARLLKEAEESRRALLSLVEDEKEVQAALRANEQRYRNLVETSFDWIWEVDTAGRLTFSSPRVKELLGYEVHEVIGRTPFDFMPHGDAKRVQFELETAAAARGQLVALENTKRHRDGRHLVLETNCVPVFAADGTWLGYRGLDRDITARRRAEHTLRLQGAALQATAAAVLITDRQGTVEWANPAFTVLNGWTLADIVGKNPRVMLKSGKHDDAFYRDMWATLNAGRVWRGEIINKRKDGSDRTEDMTITPLKDARGEITHFIAVQQDLTEQKAMQQHFLQIQRMEAIGTLASGIAHDLNNILTPILMVSATLKDQLQDDDDRELFEMAENSAKRGADIVQQLLSFSRGNEGQRAVVQVRHLIKEMSKIIRETFPREIELQQPANRDLWMVAADPSQLHQVLLNLCVNARDAMPRGGRLVIDAGNITLVENHPVLPPGTHPGPYIWIEVTDTGTGISPEIKHRIFDPFFTTKEIGKGTGLGLSTALGIVQNHGGFLTVDSTPGKGTTFKVYLPAKLGPVTSHESAPAVPPALSTTPQSLRRTIMVVDDERDVRESAHVVLERQNFRVYCAAHGEDALTLLLQHRSEISVVVTDLMMPVMNGLSLIRALRAIDPKLKIIASSGLAEEEAKLELTSLGVADVLMKPYRGADLVCRVRRELVESGTAPAITQSFLREAHTS